MDPNSTHEIVEAAIHTLIAALPTRGPAARVRAWLERVEPILTFTLASLVDLAEVVQHR